MTERERIADALKGGAEDWREVDFSAMIDRAERLLRDCAERAYADGIEQGRCENDAEVKLTRDMIPYLAWPPLPADFPLVRESEAAK